MSEQVKRNTPEEMIAAIQAWQRGELIQSVDTRHGKPEWFDITGDPTWDFWRNIYRPKPKPREFWINLHATTTCQHRAFVHDSLTSAKLGKGNLDLETIHVREVTP